MADEGDGAHDVDNKAGDEADARNPKGFLVVVKKLGVGVDLLGALEHLEVSEEVSDDETEQGQAGEGDQPFFADG